MNTDSTNRSVGKICGYCKEKSKSLFNLSQVCVQLNPPQSILQMFSIFSRFVDFIPAKRPYSDQMCEICVTRLIAAYEFHTQCLAALATFNNELKQTEKLNDNKQLRPIRCKSIDKITHNTAANRFRCRNCDQGFSSKYLLAVHRKSAHLVANPLLPCPHCSRMFHTQRTLTQHCKLHDDHICVYCNSAFPDTEALAKHSATMHTAKRKYLCIQCGRRYSTRVVFLRHLRQFHGSSERRLCAVRCGVCMVVEECSRSKLREHIRLCRTKTKQGESSELSIFEDGSSDDVEMPAEFLNYTLLEGDGCFDAKGILLGQDASQLEMVEEFLEDQKPSAMANVWMGKPLNTEDAADLSLTSLKHRYECPQCDEVNTFHSQHELNLHLANTHQQPVLVCNECGAKFNRTDALHVHRLQHKTENRLANESLSSFFRSSAQPANDESFNRSTDAFGTPTYACKRCNRPYKTLFFMMRHKCKSIFSGGSSEQSTELITTTGATTSEQPLSSASSLSCSLCDKNLTTIAGLKYHLKTHTAVRPFVCPFCPKRFIANLNLHAHIRNVHSTARPHRCAECPLAFASGYQMRRHAASVHRGDRDFVCGDCGQAFRQQSHLTQHAWQHSGVKPFPCERCDASFTSRTALKKHFAKVHADEVDGV